MEKLTRRSFLRTTTAGMAACVTCSSLFAEEEIGLCLEDEAMFASLDLQKSIGRCNCLL